MTDTIAGPQLPAYEVDTTEWLRNTIVGHPDSMRHGIAAETVLGEDAVLITFPSGGQRYVYVDDRPHGEPFHASRARLEHEASEAASQREREQEAEDGLTDAERTIEDARHLLSRIADDDRMEDLPDWLRDRIEEVESTLS